MQVKNLPFHFIAGRSCVSVSIQAPSQSFQPQGEGRAHIIAEYLSFLVNLVWAGLDCAWMLNPASLH
jgi:hypothetical protein